MITCNSLLVILPLVIVILRNLQVVAEDPDDGEFGQVYYSLSSHSVSQYGDTFQINAKTGELFLGDDPLDYEQTSLYHLSVVASDGGQSSVPAEVSVVIEVEDVNDCHPEIKVKPISIAGKCIKLFTNMKNIETKLIP